MSHLEVGPLLTKSSRFPCHCGRAQIDVGEWYGMRKLHRTFERGVCWSVSGTGSSLIIASYEVMHHVCLIVNISFCKSSSECSLRRPCSYDSRVDEWQNKWYLEEILARRMWASGGAMPL